MDDLEGDINNLLRRQQHAALVSRLIQPSSQARNLQQMLLTSLNNPQQQQQQLQHQLNSSLSLQASLELLQRHRQQQQQQQLERTRHHLQPRLDLLQQQQRQQEQNHHQRQLELEQDMQLRRNLMFEQQRLGQQLQFEQQQQLAAHHDIASQLSTPLISFQARPSPDDALTNIYQNQQQDRSRYKILYRREQEQAKTAQQLLGQQNSLRNTLLQQSLSNPIKMGMDEEERLLQSLKVGKKRKESPQAALPAVTMPILINSRNNKKSNNIESVYLDQVETKSSSQKGSVAKFNSRTKPSPDTQTKQKDLLEWSSKLPAFDLSKINTSEKVQPVSQHVVKAQIVDPNIPSIKKRKVSKTKQLMNVRTLPKEAQLKKIDIQKELGLGLNVKPPINTKVPSAPVYHEGNNFIDLESSTLKLSEENDIALSKLIESYKKDKDSVEKAVKPNLDKSKKYDKTVVVQIKPKKPGDNKIHDVVTEPSNVSNEKFSSVPSVKSTTKKLKGKPNKDKSAKEIKKDTTIDGAAQIMMSFLSLKSIPAVDNEVKRTDEIRKSPSTLELAKLITNLKNPGEKDLSLSMEQSMWNKSSQKTNEPKAALDGPVLISKPSVLSKRQRVPRNMIPKGSSIKWWPSRTAIKKEKKNKGYESDDLAASGTKRYVENSGEPGVLEKVPHCKIHSARGNGEESLFCWQVTELYPNEVMVCCSSCFTWRHAACGGHHKCSRFPAISSGSNTASSILCDRCFRENDVLKNNPRLKDALKQQREDHLRKTMSVNGVVRHAAFAEKNGEYAYPPGSVSPDRIEEHIEDVNLNHLRFENTWNDISTRLENSIGYRGKERVKGRKEELQKILDYIEGAELSMEKHNMMLFLQRDINKAHPVGYEAPRRNIFDPADDIVGDEAGEGRLSFTLDNDKRTNLHKSSDDSADLRSAISVVSSTSSSTESTTSLNNSGTEQEQSKFSHCVRRGCEKRRRYDSLFCSDACGVSALQMDLKHTLEYSNYIHPSLLHH